jgi:hypothetical protein
MININKLIYEANNNEKSESQVKLDYHFNNEIKLIFFK